MGVTGLWSIVQPCARPTKLETLNRKRLAVDASIWIYQFLKAVRDKEGNALRNSHVVGFFRRICKLLFFGIKPVFVFDGGAPALKRSVIRARKQRREGRRDDAARTAGKLLAVQMQRRAEEAEMRRKEERDRPAVVEEDVVPENEMVYVDELQMSAQERQQNRKFRKKDAYHLPDLDVSMNEMGGPNDMRVMSLEELQAYAKQFEAGEDINVYDFSKIDYDSPFFTSLPASDRYNILNAARLRSRLRMGHSKEQLDTMFPDRMAFSKFQIERVTERNELTQRLMHINGGDDAAFGANGMGRIAGEKGREYVLVKNDGVEGGWALGVVSNEGTSANEAIDVDRPVPAAKDESESDDDFVDVPVEGLNRLPRQKKPQPASAGNDLSRQRRAFYTSRRSGAKRKPKRPAAQEDPDSLFVAEQPSDEGDVEEWEEVDGNGDNGAADEDEELNRAIALSLQRDEPPSSPSASEEEQEDRLSIFQQSAVSESKAIPKGSGRAIANLVNKRAHEVAPESREVTSFGVPAPRDDSESSDEGDAMDLQAALAESRRTKRKTSPPGPRYNNALPHSPSKTRKPVEDTVANVAKKAGFSGPLPFEKLDLGSSLLGKKKMQQRTEEAMGGFEKDGEGGVEKKKSAEPLPPWFTGDVEEDMKKQKGIEDEDRRRAREYESQFQFQKREDGGLMARNGGRKGEVIDLEAEETHGAKHGEVIDLEADDSDVAGEGELIDLAPASVREDDKLVYEQTLGEVRADPPTPGEEDHRQLPPPKTAPKGPFEVDEESEEEGAVTDPPPEGQSNGNDPPRTEQGEDETAPMSPDELDAALQDSSTAKDAPPVRNEANDEEDEEMIAWSESEDEATKASKRLRAKDAEPVGGALKAAETGSDEEFQDVDMAAQRPAVPRDEQEDEFEDVDMAAKPAGLLPNEAAAPEFEFEDVAEPVENPSFPVATSLPDQEGGVEDYDDFSDPEDVEIMRALAQEAEEHARFASSLNNNQQNNKPSAQAIADYEAELKQLRNQQKKDRRDADEVTHIMITECQQLLRLFGLPYITAPMEAEAQCAELVSLGLVDGIVTDDSDCFLFGGTRIYKNFFNQGKFVECYLSSDLEKEFALTRDKLIAVAQLLGSDYTEGLPGVGPVTALEILAEFGDLDGFKAWWTGVQDQSIPKAVDATSPFRKKFRKNATKIFLPPSFPDSRVASAYTEPEVESDKQAFEWGVPDLDALRSFLMATIGWTQERTDEVLVPVIRDMNRRIDEGTQANITQFFQGGVGAGAAAGRKGGEGWAPRKRADQAGSKRLGGALRRMAERADGKGEVADPSADARDAHDGGEATAAKPKGRKRKQDDVTPGEDSGDEDEDGSDFEAPKRKTRKARGGAKAAARSRGKGTKKAVAAATAEE